MKSEKWLIYLILVSTLFTFCRGEKKLYGDSCNRTHRCDTQSLLSCIENKCQCAKPNEMIYNETAKKCSILAGEKCSFSLFESETEVKNGIKETLDCIENAICDNGYCSCMSGYYEDVKGLCREKGTNGETCTSDTECRSDLLLSCIEGFCSCNRSETVFNNGICVGKAGSACSKYGQCVLSAECGYNDRLCTCRDGYETSKDGFCLGIYSMHCNPIDSPCTQQFSCIDGKCDCHYPQHQKFYNGQCVSLVQGPCLENVTGSVLRFPCVENAECKTNDGISECTCSNGYINSYDRMCYIAHGFPCVKSDSCDPLSKLVCKNGRCACKDFHSYDEKRSLCIGLVGAECDLQLGNGFCVDGSTCQSYRFSSNEWSELQRRDRTIPSTGSCRCSKSSMVNSARECVAKLNDEELELLLEFYP